MATATRVKKSDKILSCTEYKVPFYRFVQEWITESELCTIHRSA